MSKFKHKKGKESGFTLIEMLVVIAIIAGLAALVIPMISGAKEKAAIAGDASNQADLTKQLLGFAEMRGGNYPDKMDSLLDSTDMTVLYGANAGDERGLYVTILGMGSGSLLKPLDLADFNPAAMPPFFGPGMLAWHGLANLGIENVVDHDQTVVFPNDSTDNVLVRELKYLLTDSPSYIAILNKTDAMGAVGPGADGILDNEYVQAIYEHFKLNIDDNGTDGDGNETDRVAVFGIGKENTMVGSINYGLQESPTTTCFNLNDYYGRYLAFFVLPDEMGAKAKLLGVLDPKGQLIGTNQRDFALVTD